MLIDENNINTFAEWELKIEYDIKEQLLKDFGLQVDTYANKIIKNKRNNRTSMYKYDSYESILMRDFKDKYANNLEYRVETINWIMNLFEKNKINIIEFFAWVVAIKNMDFIKINGLVLEGPTNAGKSMIIDNIVRPLKPEDIPRERDNNGFHLDQLPFAACVIFEEPIITPTNVGTWKLLLEGKITKTDQKHRDKEAIERLPIYMTTATPITANIDNRETEQINQRIKIIKFQCTINHRRDEYTKVGYNVESIAKAPTFITPYDFNALYLINYKEICDYKINLFKEHQINPERLQTEIILADIEITGAIFKKKWDTLQKNENMTEEESTKRMDSIVASGMVLLENLEAQERDTEQT